MIISLIGFMGCGKSSVGKELKRLLSCDLVDLDDYVEAMTGRTISEIFETEGEAAFRQLEWQALNEIFQSYPQIVDNSEKEEIDLILSLGGGTLTQEAAAKLVKEKSLCFYLRASVDELVADLEGRTENRPLLRGYDLRQRVEELFSSRSVLYEKSADIIVDVDGLLYHEIAEKITDKINCGPSIR